MARVVRATAPGKLVLVGEYAVLHGHPALVTAVSRRAQATLVDDDVPLAVAGLGRGPFVVARAGARCALAGDDGDALALCRAVLDAFVDDGLALPARGVVTLDSRAFAAAPGGPKLGLGSSSAVAVALAALLHGSADDDDARRAVFRTALAGHRAFSGGRGSGIDVAAGVMGGIARFRRATPWPELDLAPPLPATLATLVVFTGASQDTRTFVSAVEALRARDEGAWRAPIDAIAGAVPRFVDGCAAGDEALVLAAVDDARLGMAELGARAGIDVVSAPHRAIADVVAAHGGAAKPSGAGGGDVAVGFVPAARRATCEAALTARGFTVVDVALGAPGVDVVVEG